MMLLLGVRGRLRLLCSDDIAPGCKLPGGGDVQARVAGAGPSYAVRPRHRTGETKTPNTLSSDATPTVPGPLCGLVARDAAGEAHACAAAMSASRLPMPNTCVVIGCILDYLGTRSYTADMARNFH